MVPGWPSSRTPRQSARGNPQTSPHWTSFASDFLWASRGGARGLRTEAELECGDNSAGLRARSFLGLGPPIILMLYVTPSRFQKAPGGASRGWCFSHRGAKSSGPRDEPGGTWGESLCICDLAVPLPWKVTVHSGAPRGSFYASYRPPPPAAAAASGASG